MALTRGPWKLGLGLWALLTLRLLTTRSSSVPCICYACKLSLISCCQSYSEGHFSIECWPIYTLLPLRMRNAQFVIRLNTSSPCCNKCSWLAPGGLKKDRGYSGIKSEGVGWGGVPLLYVHLCTECKSLPIDICVHDE